MAASKIHFNVIFSKIGPIAMGSCAVALFSPFLKLFNLARPRLRPARSRVSKAAGEQHRLGEAASLRRDRNLLGMKVRAIPRGGQRLVLDLCVHLQLVWESGNFTRSSVPLIESLKKQGPFDHRCTKRKKLDSFAIDFAFQGF